MQRDPLRLAQGLRRRLAAAIMALVASAAGLPAAAAELRIALEIGATSIDPHFHNFNPNKSLHAHIYESLITRDADQRLVPGLAIAWTAVEPTIWEFKLRPGVQFSDGTPFTAEDVAFTIRRAANVQGSPSSFAFYLRPISDVRIVDATTIRLVTATPFPLLPQFISVVPIVSKRHGESATTDDYNRGRAAIGTGPFRFVSWISGQMVVLEPNDRYRGPRPSWDRVSFRTIEAPASRLAALLAGDADLIEKVPPSDFARVRENKDLALASSRSPLLVTLFPDHAERPPPFVRDPDGRPLDRNPFADLRVRQAVSLAINRQAIVERVMDGAASSTIQFMPEGFSGHLRDAAVPAADSESARRLLAAAGYPQGFQLTIHCMNNRLINDERVCQALGQMLTRAGMRTAVEVMPNATMITRAQRNEFSLWLHGMATETAEPTALLIPSVATTDRERGRGAINRGRYANPDFDRLLDQALVTLDDTVRTEIMDRAQRLLIADLAVIPLYHQANSWAMRKTIDFTARADESTLAMDARRR